MYRHNEMNHVMYRQWVMHRQYVMCRRWRVKNQLPPFEEFLRLFIISIPEVSLENLLIGSKQHIFHTKIENMTEAMETTFRNFNNNRLFDQQRLEMTDLCAVACTIKHTTSNSFMNSMLLDDVSRNLRDIDAIVLTLYLRKRDQNVANVIIDVNSIGYNIQINSDFMRMSSRCPIERWMREQDCERRSTRLVFCLWTDSQSNYESCRNICEACQLRRYNYVSKFDSTSKNAWRLVYIHINKSSKFIGISNLFWRLSEKLIQNGWRLIVIARRRPNYGMRSTISHELMLFVQVIKIHVVTADIRE